VLDLAALAVLLFFGGVLRLGRVFLSVFLSIWVLRVVGSLGAMLPDPLQILFGQIGRCMGQFEFACAHVNFLS
jgi:hypothetical protein